MDILANFTGKTRDVDLLQLAVDLKREYWQLFQKSRHISRVEVHFSIVGEAVYYPPF